MNNKILEYDFRKEYEALGFEIVQLEYFIEQQAEIDRITPHRLNFYAIIYITQGEGTHSIDFKTISFSKGSLIFVGKNQVHAWQKENNSEGFVIFFTEQFLYKNQIQFNDLSYGYPYNHNLYSPIIETSDNENSTIFSLLISLLFKEYSTFFNALQEETLQCLLRVLILKIQSSTNPLGESYSSEAKNLFIDFQKQLDQNISLTRNALDYCRMLNVSYHQLNKAIKTLTKKTIKAYIDDVLILHAKRLLADGSNNTSEVSYELGFEEPSNFTKFFKKHTGKTPKSFRAKLQEN